MRAIRRADGGPCRRKNLIAVRARPVSNDRMKMFLLPITALALTTQLALAESTNAVASAKIGAADADKYYDQEMIVTGKVAQVTLRPTIVFINLDQPFPKSPFAAVIRSETTNQFGNLKSLQGKAVEIKGTIKKYHNKPEIVLESANQLKVMGALASTNAPASQ